MKVALFCHSLLSDWNNGNAHFLRGLISALLASGHEARVFEAADAWSVRNLREDVGELPLSGFRRHYPEIEVERYLPGSLDLDRMTDGADLVLVHEWNEPELVTRLGVHRRRGPKHYKLLFHDTHHRSVSDESALGELDLSSYDGVLAFGETVRERYLRAGWANRVWTFHEAADVRLFRPRPEYERELDLIWVGNFGDDERTRELEEFVFEPARTLGLSGAVYGVRYPRHGLEAVQRAGLQYRGWIANYDVPEAFARHRLTVHVPRRPYVEALPGIPTIRVFEALASGIPLISAPWLDSEHLFRDGDFLAVQSGADTKRAMRLLLNDAAAAAELAVRGRETVLTRHTCAHRVKQLLSIAHQLGVPRTFDRSEGTPHPGASAWD